MTMWIMVLMLLAVLVLFSEPIEVPILEDSIQDESST